MHLNKILAFVGLVAGFFIFLTSTNPDSVPLVFLIIPFVFIGCFIYLSVKTFLSIFKKNNGGFAGNLIALSIALLIVMLLLLQSLDQLTWRDGLLVSIFALMFWVYIWRADFLHK